MDTDLGESLKDVSGQTTEGSSSKCQLSETEVAQSFERRFAGFENGVARNLGGLKMSFLEFTLGTQRDCLKCIEVPSKWTGSVCGASSVQLSSSASGEIGAAAGTASSPSVSQSSHSGVM